jgi:hypothetical protein
MKRLSKILAGVRKHCIRKLKERGITIISYEINSSHKSLPELDVILMQFSIDFVVDLCEKAISSIAKYSFCSSYASFEMSVIRY